jgi:hypothetical protein
MQRNPTPTQPHDQVGPFVCDEVIELVYPEDLEVNMQHPFISAFKNFRPVGLHSPKLFMLRVQSSP